MPGTEELGRAQVGEAGPLGSLGAPALIAVHLDLVKETVLTSTHLCWAPQTWMQSAYPQPSREGARYSNHPTAPGPPLSIHFLTRL